MRWRCSANSATNHGWALASTRWGSWQDVRATLPQRGLYEESLSVFREVTALSPSSPREVDENSVMALGESLSIANAIARVIYVIALVHSWTLFGVLEQVRGREENSRTLPVFHPPTLRDAPQ